MALGRDPDLVALIRPWYGLGLRGLGFSVISLFGFLGDRGMGYRDDYAGMKGLYRDPDLCFIW